MKKAFFSSMLILAVGLISLAGCNTSSDSGSSSTSESWTTENSYTKFYASTTDNCDTIFYCWPTVSTVSGSVSTTWTANVRMDTGYTGDWMGLVCFAQDPSNFYVLMVNARGEYSVRKKVAGTWSYVIAWTASSALKSGLAAENTISVSPAVNSVHGVYLNGTKVSEFTNTDVTSGGFPGILAYVSTSQYENFPTVPVDMKFKLTSPYTYP